MKPLLLMILDGFAHNPNERANAVFHAKKPVLNRVFKTNPYTELVTFGERVGLPDDQMGNSEVGHLNIGAGRVVEQELTRINRAARTGSMGTLPSLSAVFDEVKSAPGRVLHLVGLTSTGGVHSSLEHLMAIVHAARDAGVPRIVIHAITDGRDRPQTASLEDIGALAHFIGTERGGARIEIGTIIGRYFAMDRDKRWDRTEKAYDLYTSGTGEKACDAIDALKKKIAGGATDEFLEPIILSERVIEDGDSVLFFNFRTDRMRQMLHAFLGDAVRFSGFKRKKAPALCSISTLTEYEAHLPVRVLFAPFVVKNHLGDVLSSVNLKQLRIAETEKYPHVTYFFNGGVESPVAGEARVLIPSPRDVATYDLKPEMSAHGVTAALVERLGTFDVGILNFANCDMVGHTGSFDAAVKAVETVDNCCGKILAALDAKGGAAVITADHGNADQMVDYQTGEPHTFHTKYPVPFCIYGRGSFSLHSDGALCDIAPTMCDLLGIDLPPEMTGRSLIER